MKLDSSHLRAILFICSACVLLITLAYFVGSHLHFSIKLPEKSDLTKPLGGTMRCTFISTVSNSHHLRMALAVPYKDQKHWMEIKKALPRLKNEFIMAINQEGMEAIVRDRDFEVIRSLLLRTFNRNLKRPVDNIYFENFFYD